MPLRHLLLLGSLALLSACMGHKPLATPEQIAQAERDGTLPGLYNDARSRLAGKDRNKSGHAPIFAELDAIGRKLAIPLDNRLRNEIEQARLLEGRVPLNVLVDARAAADPMQQWDPSRHDVLLRDIARDSAATEKAVREAGERLAALPGNALRKRRDVLEQLEQLTGDTRHRDRRAAELAALRAAYDEAIATDQFEKALALIDELPPEKTTEQVRVDLQTRLFERRFNESLADDRPEEAYRLFLTLAESPYFGDVKERLGPTGNDMANYFIALGAAATEAGNAGEAWSWFTQSRNVRQRLNGRADAVPEEKPFVAMIQRGHDNARKNGLWGVALGHLYIIQDFDPAHATLARDIRAAEEQVNHKAIRSGRILPFTSAAGIADYSGTIRTRLTESLFQSIPTDLRILPPETTDAEPWYLISGSIDEARVETDEKNQRKTTRVITQRGVPVRNPVYDEWLKLPERDRVRVPQPPATIAEDRKEDVVYSVMQLRKAGYFSVAFRVVEAGSGKLVYTDSVPIKRELADEGNEGVELGDFVLQARVARLPTDIEILDQLVNEASREIAKRLAGSLGGLEQRYAEEGGLAGGAGNSIEAAERYAAAVAVGRRKQLDVSTSLAELKRQAAGTGFAR